MLAFVVVNKYDAVIELVVGHKLKRFPVLSLVHLPVADAHIYVLIVTPRGAQAVGNAGRH